MLDAIVATAIMGAKPSTAVPVQDEPLHHVVYSDSRLRVFDVDLPPHAVTLYHIHAKDMVGVTLIPGPMRMIAIELLASSASRKMGVKRQTAGEVQLENDSVRAVRFSLRPGQTLPVHTNGSYVLVPLGPGRLANVCGTTEPRSVEIAGFCVRDLMGTTRFRMWAIPPLI